MKRVLDGTRDRWATVHIEADRRRPFGHIGERTPEPAGLTANQIAARMLAGMAFGAVLATLFGGRLW